MDGWLLEQQKSLLLCDAINQEFSQHKSCFAELEMLDRALIIAI